MKSLHCNLFNEFIEILYKYPKLIMKINGYLILEINSQIIILSKHILTKKIHQTS